MMNSRKKILHIFFTIQLLLCLSLFGYTQPTLPNISGKFENNKSLLSWTCQYDGIKSIDVRRSNDSVSNFVVIGKVNKLKKGIQQFTDNAPLNGINYYKLAIVFNSGLKWSSNTIHLIHIDEKNQEVSNINDSLKNLYKRHSSSKIEYFSNVVAPSQKLKRDTSLSTGHLLSPERRTKFKILTDTLNIGDTSIKSKCIYKDSLTGHIRIYLPEDIRQHHYSLRIYNTMRQLLYNIPYFNASNIYMEKRNFQYKGIYLFVLKKDGIEVERCYINI